MWLSLLYALNVVAAHLTTSPPALDYAHIDTRNEGALQRLGRGLVKRRVDCDPSSFFCPTGTCFTDPSDGYIGCCTTDSCAPRTNCIQYTSTVTSPCDSNTGGCIYCSDSANPYCFTITNIVAHQYIVYCATITSSTQTVAYVNPVTTGSQYTPRTSSSTTTSPTATSISTAATTTIPHSSTGSGVVVIITSTSSSGSAATSTSDGAQLLSQTANAASPTAGSGSTTLAGGAIGGIVAGSIVAVIAFVAGLWFLLRKKRKQPYVPVVLDKKDSSLDTSPASSGTKEYPAEAEGSTPKTISAFSPAYSPEHIAQRHEADSQAVSEVHGLSQVQGLGIKSINRNSRAVGQTRPKSVPSPYISDSSNRQSYHISPMLTQDDISSSKSSPSPAKTPPHSAQQQVVPLSPSVYSSGAPGSIRGEAEARRTSEPQPHSAASTTSNAPWAYLSAEDAMAGGWINPPDRKG